MRAILEVGRCKDKQACGCCDRLCKSNVDRVSHKISARSFFGKAHNSQSLPASNPFSQTKKVSIQSSNNAIILVCVQITTYNILHLLYFFSAASLDLDKTPYPRGWTSRVIILFSLHLLTVAYVQSNLVCITLHVDFLACSEAVFCCAGYPFVILQVIWVRGGEGLCQ